MAQQSSHHFEILTEKHLDETLELLYLSFTHSNPLWRKFNLTKEIMMPYLRYRVTPSIASQTSSVLICDEKVAACQVGVDYVDYLIQRKEGVEIPTAFTFHSLVIQDSLDAELPRNHTLMNHFTAVHPDYQGRGFYPALNKNGYRVTNLGYVNSFTITTNPITEGKTKTIPGIKLIRSVKFEEESHPLFGVQMDLFEVPLVAPTEKKIESW